MKHLKRFNDEELEKSMDLLKDALFVTEMENDRSSPEVQEELAQELLNRFLETKNLKKFEGLFSSSGKDPKMEKILDKISDAAYSPQKSKILKLSKNYINKSIFYHKLF